MFFNTILSKSDWGPVGLASPPWLAGRLLRLNQRAEDRQCRFVRSCRWDLIGESQFEREMSARYGCHWVDDHSHRHLPAPCELRPELCRVATCINLLHICSVMLDVRYIEHHGRNHRQWSQWSVSPSTRPKRTWFPSSHSSPTTRRPSPQIAWPSERWNDTPRYSTILDPQVESVAQPRKNRVSSGLGTRDKRSSLNETLVDKVWTCRNSERSRKLM